MFELIIVRIQTADDVLQRRVLLFGDSGILGNPICVIFNFCAELCLDLSDRHTIG